MAAIGHDWWTRLVTTNADCDLFVVLLMERGDLFVVLSMERSDGDVQIALFSWSTSGLLLVCFHYFTERKGHGHHKTMLSKVLA